MKCVLCNGKTVERLVEYTEFNAGLGKFKANVCERCGEQYFDEKIVEQIQNLSKKLGLFGLAKKSKIAQVGNSIAIRIPKEIVRFLNLKKGKEVVLFPKNRHDLHIQV